MNSSLRITILLLASTFMGCAGASPRGLSWGFMKSKSTRNTAQKPDSTKSKRGSNSEGLASKTSRKKPLDSSSRKNSSNKDSGEKSSSAVDKLLSRAKECDDRNDLNEAMSQYKQVLELSPDHPIALRRLANIADLQNRFADAESYYKQGLANRPNDPELLNDLGYSYFLQNRFEESEQTLRKALAVNPEHLYALNNLGYIHVKRSQANHDPREYQLALELFQKANGDSTAQTMIQDAFPNGPPQAIAQSTTPPDSFGQRPTSQAPVQNPFETERATGTPNQPPASSDQQFAQQTPAMAAAPPTWTQPVAAVQNAAPTLPLQPAASTIRSPVVHADDPTAQQMPPLYVSPIASSNQIAAPTVPATETPATPPLPPQAIGSQQLPVNSLNTIATTSPNSLETRNALPPNGFQSPNENPPQAWNSIPASGSTGESHNWEAAQRAAAELSMSTMFPVSDSTGRPLPQTSFPQSGGAVTPAQGSGIWSSPGASNTDQPIPPPANNSITPPANTSPNGGWQSPSPGQSNSFPGPNPFETKESVPPSPTQGSYRQMQSPAGNQRSAMATPNSGNLPNGNNELLQTSGSMNEIEQFENELMRSSTPASTPQSQQRRGATPTIQPATASYPQ